MTAVRELLLKGLAIPALPLALDEKRQLSGTHQQALVRYYVEAGCGGLAVAVHSTQFEIRDPQHNLFEPVLALASETIDRTRTGLEQDFVKILGICGDTPQALKEAETGLRLGYHAALLSLAHIQNQEESAILQHCREVAARIPIIGFYLQPAVGGRRFPYSFWRKFVEIEQVVAVKIAPFDRYCTLDVVRAVIESGRRDIALYTGNDDNIIADLLTPFTFNGPDGPETRFIDGGLLGQWGVWTRRAVLMFEEIKRIRQAGGPIPLEWLELNAALTDMNAAVFDAANGFAGCIPGILEVLRSQGLIPGRWCLDPHETLSPGQAQELERVRTAYPDLVDDAFVEANLDHWLDSD